MADHRELASFLSGLAVSQGRRAGERFALQSWQARFVRGAFRPHVASAALSVSRANGKTTLLSGIAAACLDGPLAVPRGEVVIVSGSFEQARIAFEHVSAFMSPTLEADRELPVSERRWRVWDTAQQARIEDRRTGARVWCIGSDPRRAHGLAPTLVLADEPAQWPETTGERMVAALCGRRRASNLPAGSWRSGQGRRIWRTGSRRCSQAAPITRSVTRPGRVIRHFSAGLGGGRIRR